MSIDAVEYIPAGGSLMRRIVLLETGSIGSAAAMTESIDSRQLSERYLEESIADVREALRGMRFGAVALTVHDGRLVQIDITEKRRFKPSQ